jgi:tight adherence protein B
VTGLALGLCAGLGLFSIWWACWPDDTSGSSGVHVRRRRLERWSDDAVVAGLPVLRPGRLLAVSLAAGGVTTLLVLGLTGVLAIAVCFGAMAVASPAVLVRTLARRRRSHLRDLWPDVVDNLASGVRAGLSLPEALGQLSIRGPEQLRPPFAEFAQDYRATGRFNDALDRLKERLADPVGDRVVESLRVARDVGGNDLGQLLRTLSQFLRHEARTRGELESRQSWTVNGARLAVAAPWLVLAMLCTRPESVAAYGRPAGAVVLGSGAGLSLLAYRLMVRIARLPDEERVLR